MSRMRMYIAIAVLSMALVLTLLPAYADVVAGSTPASGTDDQNNGDVVSPPSISMPVITPPVTDANNNTTAPSVSSPIVCPPVVNPNFEFSEPTLASDLTNPDTYTASIPSSFMSTPSIGTENNLANGGLPTLTGLTSGSGTMVPALSLDAFSTGLGVFPDLNTGTQMPNIGVPNLGELM